MIISASRRTDIPAFYTEWFLNRIKAGYVDVINPFDTTKASRLNLKSEYVTCIVFWTKNPKPLLKRIDELKDYRYYFQYTLNAYEKDVEPGVPPLEESIKTFIELSKKIGKEKVIWRYDPIILTKKYDIDWHVAKFEYLIDKLNKYTEKVVISFVDLYKKTNRNTKDLGLTPLGVKEMNILADKLSKLAHKHKLDIATCSEKIDLDKYGISHNKCIDNELIERLFNVEVTDKRDGQREACGCVACTDIGVYNTCLHRCKYCYATFNYKIANNNYRLHDPKSTTLIGKINNGVKIYLKEQTKVAKKSFKQGSLFDYAN
ncbi:MAG: DUF1848 domain-containing protein [Bacilli bacterium]|nr:DUF1848 domain-containing protein [Bacilli bacterium]